MYIDVQKITAGRMTLCAVSRTGEDGEETLLRMCGGTGPEMAESCISRIVNTLDLFSSAANDPKAARRVTEKAPGTVARYFVADGVPIPGL